MISQNQKQSNLFKNLNIFLQRTKAIFDIEVIQMLTYLDEEGFKLERLTPLLSEENMMKVKIFTKSTII